MARAKTAAVPEVGARAPEFNLPSAQGGQLKLSMRTVRGPVVVAFYGGAWSGEDVAYFRDLASKEREINLAGASIVGIGRAEPEAARDFARETGIKSYVLYDYAGLAARDYGLLEKDKEHGEHARPATFLINGDHEVVHAWVGERPEAEEILRKVSDLTGLPKAPEEGDGEAAAEEKPKRRPRKAVAGEGNEEAGGKAEDEAAGERKKLSPEERERRRAERKAAGEGGQSEAPDGGTDKGSTGE